jgi:hypothetical protein
MILARLSDRTIARQYDSTSRARSEDEQLRRRIAIAIDGTTRTRRDRQDMAIAAATFLKIKQPNSAITVRDIESGQTTTIKHPLESL